MEKFSKLLGSPIPLERGRVISSQAEHIKHYVPGRFRDYNGNRAHKSYVRGWDSPFSLGTKSTEEAPDGRAIRPPATRLVHIVAIFLNPRYNEIVI